MKDGTVIEIDNVAPEPALAFEMSPVEALPYVKAGTIAATWHTHPYTDPTLSHMDDDGFKAWPDLDHYIIGVRDGEVLTLKYQVEEGLVVCV